MRICIVYQGEFPPAERIEKTARTLTADGHQVYVLVNNYGTQALHEEQVAEASVLRVRPTFRVRSLNKLLKFPVFLNPLWIAHIERAVRKHRIDALQVVDVPLAAAVLAIGRLAGIPVVYDMWENYPEALRGWAHSNWKTRLFKNYRVARAVERYVAMRVDHIFTVVKEARERVLQLGVPAERVSVVTNGVDPEMFSTAAEAAATPLDGDEGAYKLLYVGAVTTERGLDDVIRALPHVLEQLPQVRLYIAGSGDDEARLRGIAAELGLGAQVRFLGWVPFTKIHAHVMSADLCLVPHVYNDFINTTVPNKLFQYMMLAKPVLVSHARPLARIVREAGCGFVFESGNPADAAEKIMEAFSRRADAAIGARGARAVEERYTWDKAARNLLRVYRDLDRRRPAAQ